MQVTKTIEWDMGHRIPNHDSKCKNPHGHRYKLEITLEGAVNSTANHPHQGMVIDFGEIKNLLKNEVDTLCDHSFMFFTGDTVMKDFYIKNAKLKHLAVPFIPTAEEIANWLFKKLTVAVKKTHADVTLVQLQLWETPNSSAIVTHSTNLAE